jgi:oligopeptide transport system substrate-binding protein
MPDSLDPAIGQLAVSALLYKQLFTPLTDYADTLELAPGLARDWSTPDNGRTWLFRLREGLEWSDGHPLTADDVVWSVRRFLDPATAGGELGDFFAVENALAVLGGDLPASELGVTSPDPDVVEFRLTQPLGLFPTLMREFYPFPRHAIEVHGNDWVRPVHFVGSGPFTLADQGALSYDLSRNAHAIRPAAVAAARVDIVDDAATRTRMFRAGEFDLAEGPNAAQIPALRDILGGRLRSFPAPKFTYLKINLRRPALANAAVRRALSAAIDRRFLAEQIMGGTAFPSESVLRPGIVTPGGVEQAQRLLEQAGLTGSRRPSVVLRTSSGERERLAIAIADDWNRAGIETEMLATEPVDLYSSVDGGDFDVALSHFDRGLKRDPNFLMEPFARGGFADDSGWFETASADAERFSGLIDGARSEVSPDIRTRLYLSAEARLLDQQIIIPLLHEQAHWLVSERVTGLTDGVQPQLWRRLSVP